MKRNIQSSKIDISKKTWVIFEADVINKNNYEKVQELKLKTNFDFKEYKLCIQIYPLLIFISSMN